MAEIVLEGVTKVYPGDVKAVDDVTLRIEAGEFAVLVGPTGCGKSTLLRVIAGLEEVTDGLITIGGRGGSVGRGGGLGGGPAAAPAGRRGGAAGGRGLVREPKAFLMDEPLSNL